VSITDTNADYKYDFPSTSELLEDLLKRGTKRTMRVNCQQYVRKTMVARGVDRGEQQLNAF
jgi:hypothetical protein